jgi:putative glycosyltransferase (TIGR04372 family)
VPHAERRSAGNLLAQTGHTVRPAAWPSRLFAAALLLPARFPHLLTLLLSILPVDWPRGEKGKAFRLAVGNLVLLRHDRPEQAWFWMQRVLRSGTRSIEEYFLGAVCLYQGLGRMREATALFGRANERDFATAQALGVAHLPYRVLDETWVRHIGDAATLDYVIKRDVLEGRGAQDIILYAPPEGRIGNRFLVQQLSQRLRLVERADELPFAAPALGALHYHYQFPRQADGSTVFFWDVAAGAQRRWLKEGRRPLLEFPPEVAARGWALLEKAGVPRDARFVALHVRDIVWRGVTSGLQAIRNADTVSYLRAIDEITRRGGFVVRMGDADAPRLPPHAQVIDYCRSDMRSDWMDIFLLARSRFVLGSASGPVFVPPLYGVPSVLTNWWPPGMRPWHASDIYIPKLAKRITDGTYLTLSEMLREPVSYCHSLRYLAERHGLGVEDNAADIIHDAVVEMFMRLEGGASSDAELEDLRTRADRIYQSHGHIGMAQPSRGFLRRYRDLIA